MNIGGKGERLLKPPRYKREWRNICAILPAYLPDGTNGTEITYTDGTVEKISYRLCWVLDDILGHLRSSTAILKKQSRLILGNKARRVPLLLCSDFALVPVKGRDGIGAYDKNVGYIVLQHVKELIPETDGTRIIFSGNAEVQVKDRPRTVWENLMRAKTAKLQMCA